MNQPLELRRQGIFYRQLLALGFDSEAMSKEHKTVFNEKMFCLPNKKAFEVVTRFLFCKLNEVSEKQYDLIWPLVDSKDFKTFPKLCFRHLSDIAKESEIRFPVISTSVLSSYGDNFYKLYLAFSTHVVLQTNKKYDTPMLKRAKYDPRFYGKYVEILKINYVSSVEKFQKIIEMSSNHLDAYFATAKKLVSYIEKVKLSNATSEGLLKEKIEKASLLFKEKYPSSHLTIEKLVSMNMEYQNKVEKLWKCLEKFFEKETKLWSYLSSELDEDIVKPILKGKEFIVSVPESLQEFSEENQASLTEDEKKLNIPRFLKIFNIILEICLRSMKEGNFSETYTFQLLNNNSCALKDCFEALHSLNVLAKEMTVEDKKNVKSLMENLCLKVSLKDEMAFSDEIPPLPCTSSKSSDENSIFDENFEDLLKEKEDKERYFKEKVDEIKIENDKSCNELISQNSQVLSVVENEFESLEHSVGAVAFPCSTEFQSTDFSGLLSTEQSRSKISDSIFSDPERWLLEESQNCQLLHLSSDSD